MVITYRDKIMLEEMLVSEKEMSNISFDRLKKNGNT